MPTPSPRQVLIAIAMAVIIVWFTIDRIGQWRARNQAVDQATAPLTSKIEATSGINSDAAIADGMREQADRAAATASANFRRSIARANQDDPTTADRASRPVPVGVRDAFRERRITVERSGCTGSGCPETAP